MCFLECFWVFLVSGREKKCREQLGRRKISEKICVLTIKGELGAIYCPGGKN